MNNILQLDADGDHYESEESNDLCRQRYFNFNNANQSTIDATSSPKTLDKEINIDKQIAKVLQDIEEVDTFLRQLNQRRENLVCKYDSLKEEKVIRKTQHLATLNWESKSFPWHDDVRKALADTFNMTDFREQQLKTINAVLSKQDVLLLAPTGGGKSLCFQLPAIIQKGITLVVSPLISLMEDQVWSMQRLNINAELLCSTTDNVNVNRIHKVLATKTDNCKFGNVSLC